MKKISETEKKIKRILETVPITRKDDNMLYITYWKLVAPDVSFINFFKTPSKYGGATFKRVERCRRKLQARYEELREKESANARFEESLKYEQYVLDR